MIRRLGLCLFAAALAACSFTTIADRYGNLYGDWYNPGGHFAWQLDLCEQQMEQQNIPLMQRKASMRCCMRDHGVPVDNVQGCSA
ncbi:MAG TPA: hypothetical protein VN668_12640 [Stellaceae bacterium]|nr:hypothetical protein [Stellaceae bacterium]